ncbi:class I SAM-dependent methyltransferase [Phenylobacterium sp.]|uniref:class I SAM-dependent methyltransferase n=1 Tax=Phenylobacterium sp. TaxID=1871053 RepID=UPI002D003AA3|nr:class I SAM-dependent methyltransferase [Phenylobacterium sp.]HLZ76887.1 class I SAM-dependent methyltransferase [Phenylobacterium sp.]
MAETTTQTDSAAIPAAAAHPRKALQGPPYRDFVKAVTDAKAARNYLEVGVHNGSTLALIEKPAIGVDPNFVFDRNPVGRKRILHLFQMGSDEFFRDYDPRAIFGAPVDVAFLDGMHRFEYLLRDFMNTERVCDRNGVILMDDCLPVNLEMTERLHRPEQRQDKALAGWWTGDVWKVVTILREYRPDLRITPVDVVPTGSIVVSNLDPSSTRLADAYFEIVDRFAAQTLTPKDYEAYWKVNRPTTAAALLNDFGLSLHVRP